MQRLLKSFFLCAFAPFLCPAKHTNWRSSSLHLWTIVGVENLQTCKGVVMSFVKGQTMWLCLLMLSCLFLLSFVCFFLRIDWARRYQKLALCKKVIFWLQAAFNLQSHTQEDSQPHSLQKVYFCLIICSHYNKIEPVGVTKTSRNVTEYT